MKKDKGWQSKILLILLLVIVSIYFYINNSRKVPSIVSAPGSVTSSKPQASPVGHKQQSSNAEIPEQIASSFPCLKKHQIELSGESFESVWRNVHFQKAGEIFRVREFIDDAGNGDLKKVILYKEDQDGFAHINKIYTYKDFLKHKKDIFKNSKIIHTEDAYTSSNTNTFLEFVNGKLKRVNHYGNQITPVCL